MKQIEKYLVSLNTETLWLSEATEVINETPVNISSPFIVQEMNISRITKSFRNKFEHVSVIRI